MPDLLHQSIPSLEHGLFTDDFRYTGKHLAFALTMTRQHAILEIDGNISVGHEHAHLSLDFLTDPAGRDVGYTAVLECDTRVGDVDVASQYRHTLGIDTLDLTVDQIQNDIDIVDHEVEYYADVV